MRLFKKKDDYFEAIVLLLTTPRLIEAPFVQSILPPTHPSPTAVRAEISRVRAASPEYAFNVSCAPVPYGHQRGGGAQFLADRCPDLRMKEQILRHRAFVSVNCDAETPENLRRSSAVAMSKVAAELVDDTTVALMDTVTNRIILPSPKVVALLREGNRAEAVQEYEDPVVGVDPNSIEVTVAEARRRYPELVAAFLRAKPDSKYTVKMAFRDPGSDYVEHMWINPTALTESAVSGTLESEPHRLRSVRRGSEVTKPVSDLSDWAFIEDGACTGMFSERAVRRQSGVGQR